MQYVTIFSRNEPILVKDVERIIEWPLKMPKKIMALNHAESIFDALDLYLWLSYRFSEMFPDAEAVREIRKVVDQLINNGIQRILAGRSSNKKDDKQVDIQQIRKHETYKRFLRKENEKEQKAIKNGSSILNNDSEVIDFIKLFSNNSVENNIKISNKKKK
jgi:altronate dehydratase